MAFPAGVAVTLILALGMSTPAAAQVETYRFERMWPALRQPWYFFRPTHIASGGGNIVYVADTDNHRIQKLNMDGQFITSWGTAGDGAGQFNQPRGVAVDADGRVYVVDSGNNRVQRFSSNGAFERAWGAAGFVNGAFNAPDGIAIGPGDAVYVADTANGRIQQFTGDGDFIRAWGGFGFGGGQFISPAGVCAGPDGTVYVVDKFLGRVQRFTAEGEYLTRWDGSNGGVPFNAPWNLTVDGAGHVLVADTGNGLIQRYTAEGAFIEAWGDPLAGLGAPWQPVGLATIGRVYALAVDRLGMNIRKFTPQGRLLASWGSKGAQEGFMHVPGGVVLGPDGDVFVADTENQRIQRFSADGIYKRQWGGRGTGDGQFLLPFGVAVSVDGVVYVVDYDASCVQRFDTEGNFLGRWGGPGAGPGEFAGPTAAALDSKGNVYVTDTVNNRTQKFTAEGAYLGEWGQSGDPQADLDHPIGVAIGPGDRVYVADTRNHRVCEFTAAGAFVRHWGSAGGGDGQFNAPKGIASDASGRVFVVDTDNHRVQLFTGSGGFVTAWGRSGVNPGEMLNPAGLAIRPDGTVYVADQFNDRIQVFRPVTVAVNAKAIVVAAGGPFPGNDLWDATQFCANYVYRTLTLQGFTKESIYYLSSDLDLDLDGNGAPDEVDAGATNAGLEYALRTWAAGADALVVYLVDHGGLEKFRMSGAETLDAADFAAWLAEAGAAVAGTVTVVYEACQSGSFVSALAAAKGPGRRIVITSASEDEPAYFLSTGTVSFSNFFWTQILNGASVGEAFQAARQSISRAVTRQTPQLDDDGDGLANEESDGALAALTFIGNLTSVNTGAPVITAVSGPQSLDGTATAPLYADVSDPDGIARVWAVITPPIYAAPSPGAPVLELPHAELLPAGPSEDEAGPERWEGTWDGFSSEGIYSIAVYARDRIGNTSVPALTTVTSGSPLRKRAVICAGGDLSDPLWPGVARASALAYNALLTQGYADADIYFLSPAGTAGVDGTNVLANLAFALTDWALGQTQDFLFYYVGEGGNQVLPINASESLAAEALDAWLDALQASVPGTVIVALDACQSATFLEPLTAPAGMRRIVIASAGAHEVASFMEEGNLSFSRFFWQQIVNGATVWSAFQHARLATRFTSKTSVTQVPQLDDDGDGVSGVNDGRLARGARLGAGVLLAGDAPIIGEVSGPQVLDGTAVASLEVYSIAATGGIALVWAVITPPEPHEGTCAAPFDSTVALTFQEDGTYAAQYAHFTDAGEYDAAFYAMGQDGAVSIPQSTAVTQRRAATPHDPADVNLDGVVDATDVQLVINGALDVPTPGLTTDVNQDGVTNAVDVQLVILAALK